MKKTFKRVLSVALVVLMLVTSAPLQGFVGVELPEWSIAKAVSENIIASGNCGANGDNVTWVLYDDGEIVISGQGSMANYTAETTPWYSYRMDISEITIKEGVTHIGAYSFYCHSNVTELYFSSTVISIGNFAFIACSSLTEIVLPDTIKTIGWGVFEGCSSAESAKVGNGISYINGALFCNCKNLKRIELSDSVNQIERMTFFGCDSLKDIYYLGEKDSWAKISIGIDNSPLSNVKISYIADDAVEFDGRYYKFFDNGMTWDEAETYCESLGGHLCTITTEDENNFIKEILTDSTNYNYWLGGRKYVDSWKWITNEEFSYSNWNEGEPNNDQRSGGEDRLLIYGPYNPSFGEWNDINNDCTCGDEPYFKVETFGFICEWDGMNVDIPFEFNGHYYKLYDAELSWIDSKSFCEELGGYLVTITSEEEQTFIETLLSSADKNMYWMGGLLQEDWAWITGEDFLYTNWGYGEPNNSNAYEAYVQIYAKPINQKVLGDWNDAESDGAAYSNVFYSLENTGLICEWSDEHFEKDTCEFSVTESKDATCLRDGYIVNTCTCGYVYTQVLPAGHIFNDWVIDVEPSIFKEGKKHRSCTGCRLEETETIERIEIDIETNENYGIANFTVLNSSTKAPIKNASIFVSTDTEGESTFYTDENGKVSIVLPIGENVITAHAKGLISRTLTIDIVHGENEIPTIGLGSSPIVEAELVTTPMTKEEIEDAGIDVTAPENNNVIKYEVTFEFKAPEESDDDSGSGSETETKTETVKETFYVNSNGDHFYQNNNPGGGTYEIFGEPVTIHPTERFYLIITGDLIWLKEMFHVQLYAYNNSNTDWIEDTVATLQLPDGLSLADMSEGEQTLSQQMGTIPEGGQADCEWYVRGDKEGIYDLTAKLEGRIMPFNEEFSNEYTAEEAIKVYSGKAFNISFEVPTTTYCGDEYPVKITLENVSDKPIYNVAHVLTGISQTKVTHYSNGEAVEEIYVKETLDKAKFVDEFNPGDEIVLDVTAKILFESEKYKDCFFELVDIVFGAKELGTAINNNFGFPTEHDWGEWETVKEPTCGEPGQEKRICKHNENHVDTRETETLPHDWDEGVINPVSTCKDHGIKTYTCKNDASHTKEEKVPLDADNHIGETYIADEIANTCEEDGYTGNTYCVGCNVKLTDGESIAAHGHDYHKVDEKCKAPDYGIAGYDYYECSYDASHNYTVEVAPLVKTTFTAKFITTAPFFKEDKVVAEVTFVQGDKFVEEPAVDKYDNYTFAWDEYELKDEDIVIYGRYTEIEINDITTPEAEKKAEINNGVATITLEAKANSKNIKILSEKTKPVDVVLVLDQSGSMAETLSTNGKTKRDALVECANDFVKELYDNAVATGADHRVAVVGFSYSDYDGGNYKNTGILATANGKSINYKYLKDADYASALMSVVAADGINANITKGINSVVADGATSAHLGLEMANNIFAMTNKESGRERIVLFITDGTPTSWGEETDLVKTTAAKAITEANELKNAQGAKVYSIGVHANANPTAGFTSDDYGVATDNRGSFKSYDFNRFLHAVSSNYPTAGSIRVSEMGEGSKNSGYYLGVQDTSKLSEIFSKILLSSVYEVKTFDKVTIVDTVSKEFTLTLEQETEMRERLISELGIRNEDITVIRNEDGTTTLRFDNVRTQKVYNDDGSSYYSAKLSFDISADEDSLGLTEVNTNTEDAGVEYDGETLEKFDVPTVVLEPDRKLIVFTVNGTVYRIEEAKLGDNVIAPESSLAEWNIPEGTVVEGDYVVFEANAIESVEYTVTWVSENSKVTEAYSFGDEIVIPEPAEKADYDFLKWSPDVPATMPNYNITFTAAYTPKHSHTYNKAYTYGKCTEGITTVYECACGDSYEEKADITEHSAKAVVEKTNSGTLIEKVTCQVCGVTNSQELTYKVTYREGWRNTVLDLTLLENDVSVQPDGTLEIRFYVGENINKNYTVYRIDENGNRTSYTPRKENGYLIFDADHFSFYVVAELDEETGEVADDTSYEEVYCVSNGHSYEGVVTEPTCSEKGYTTYTCSVCKDSYVADEVSALGHTEVTVKGYDATCTEIGLTDGVKCSVCDEFLTAQEVIPASGHKEETVNGKAATCIETGLTDGVKCSTCGITLTAQKIIDKLAHKDDNCDYKCDYGCGHEFEKPVTPDEPDTPDEPIDGNCDHLCHKNGFMGFIWKIVRFFIKLFRTNKVCGCGVNHY